MKSNNCNGECLRQSTDPNIYYRGPKSTCTCLPVACPNYAFCGTVYPALYNSCWNGRCVNCDIVFGCNLEFKTEENFECCMCMKMKSRSVKMPLQNKFCIICFKKLQGWRDNVIEYDPETFDANDYMCTYEEHKQELENEPSTNDSYDETTEESSEVYSDRGCPLCRVVHIQRWIH